MTMRRPRTITFLVEDAPEGGFTVRAERFSIFTEADSWADLCRQIRDAARCFFDEATLRGRPKILVQYRGKTEEEFQL
jgi:hypothetical protein